MNREESEREEVNPMEVINVLKRVNQARGACLIRTRICARDRHDRGERDPKNPWAAGNRQSRISDHAGRRS
jgi:hypothetical protein